VLCFSNKIHYLGSVFFFGGYIIMIIDYIDLSMVDYPGYLSSICFFRGCQLRCLYCHNSSLVLPELFEVIDNDIEEKYFKYLDNNKNILEAVVISGGEPLLDNNLEKFIKRVKSFGLLIKLDTNGFLPDVLERYLKMNIIDYVALDFKALPRDLERLVGLTEKRANEYFLAFDTTLKLLIKYNINFEVRTTVINEVHNEEILIKMSEHLANRLANSKVIWYLQNYQESKDNLYHFIDENIIINSCSLQELEMINKKTKYKFKIR